MIGIKTGTLGFLVFKMQMLLFAVLVVAALRMVVEFWFFAALDTVVSAYYFYVLGFEIRSREKGEWKHYLVFFGVLWAILQAVWVAQVVLPVTQHYIALIGVLVALLLFALFYRIVLGRGYIMARVVMCEKGTAVVETDFDIRSFTRAGKYVVECKGKCAKGRDVKVALSRGLLGGKPRRVVS